MCIAPPPHHPHHPPHSVISDGIVSKIEVSEACALPPYPRQYPCPRYSPVAMGGCHPLLGMSMGMGMGIDMGMGMGMLQLASGLWPDWLHDHWLHDHEHCCYCHVCPPMQLSAPSPSPIDGCPGWCRRHSNNNHPGDYMWLAGLGGPNPDSALTLTPIS